MLEVNHEYKNYIAYLFLDVLGIYSPSLPDPRPLTVIGQIGFVPFCFLSIRCLVCGKD